MKEGVQVLNRDNDAIELRLPPLGGFGSAALGCLRSVRESEDSMRFAGFNICLRQAGSFSRAPPLQFG
jgi:hypothetical protein